MELVNLALIIILFNFITGTLCLIYGVNLMSSGLEKANLDTIKKIITKCTRSVPSAFITGTLITALVQSSTAVTVITVSLVNSGILKFSNAVGIIFGANLGTTITAQLLSLDIKIVAVPLIFLGLVMMYLVKNPSLKNVFKAVTGLGLMFLGIAILNSGVPYIKESKLARDLFISLGQSPMIGLIAGMVTTMLVHSSSATVGLTIVLFNSGLISFEAAIAITLGDNIGTCITAQLASLKTGISARRTAWAHTIYNIIGVLAALIFFSPFAALVCNITSFIGQDSSRLVANTHTIFNILSAVAFLPFTKYYVRFIEFFIHKKGIN